MKKIAFVFGAVLAMSLCACSDDETTNVDNGGEVANPFVRIELSRGETQVANSGYGFAWDLFGKANAERANENVCLSPLSAEIALTMLLNGAEGETRDEIVKVLGLEGMTIDEINQNSEFLVKELMDRDKACKLASANSLWLSGDIQAKDAYKLIIKNYYRATVSNTTMANFAKDVNSWCNDNTEGLIPCLMEDDESYQWALLNALYFQNTWARGVKFESGGTNDFTNFDGSKSKAPFMKGESLKISYAETDNARHAHIPFGNYAYYMSITLPNEGVDLDKCIEEMQSNADNFRYKYVADLTLTMPKFALSTNYDLNNVLQSLGMVKAFNADAELSNLSDDAAIVSKVKQSCIVKVDEKGAVAAAATSVGGDLMANQNPHPDPMVVDRPFIFTIYESSTNCILFIGKIERF